MSDLAIRAATPTERDVRAIFDLLLRMFDEAPLQRLDSFKAMVEINRVCAEEAAWIVEEDGRLVASAGMVRGGLWYSEEPILVTRWLYAVPEHRGPNGAFGLMLEEIRALGETTEMTAWLDVFNPQKAPRAGGRLEAGFARFSFDARGRRLKLLPKKHEETV